LRTFYMFIMYAVKAKISLSMFVTYGAYIGDIVHPPKKFEQAMLNGKKRFFLLSPKANITLPYNFENISFGVIQTALQFAFLWNDYLVTTFLYGVLPFTFVLAAGKLKTLVSEFTRELGKTLNLKTTQDLILSNYDALRSLTMSINELWSMTVLFWLETYLEEKGMLQGFVKTGYGKQMCQLFLLTAVGTPWILGIGAALNPCSPTNLLVPFLYSCGNQAKLEETDWIWKLLKFIGIFVPNAIFWKVTLVAGDLICVHILVGVISQTTLMKVMMRSTKKLSQQRTVIFRRAKILNDLFNLTNVDTILVGLTGLTVLQTCILYILFEAGTSPSVTIPAPVTIWCVSTNVRLEVQAIVLPGSAKIVSITVLQPSEISSSFRIPTFINKKPHNHILHNESIPFSVVLSTKSETDIPFALFVNVTQDFLLELDSTKNFTLSPNRPYYFRYQFNDSKPIDSVRILADTNSTGDSCMTLSVQTAMCPIYDQEESIYFEGYYQTIRSSGQFLLKRSIHLSPASFWFRRLLGIQTFVTTTTDVLKSSVPFETSTIWFQWAYVLFGVFFIITASKRKTELEAYEPRSNENNALINELPEGAQFGVPIKFGMFKALGAALLMEGVLSASYHMCPNEATFQFDTCFMYVIAVLIIIHLRQLRNIQYLTPYVVFAALACIGILSVGALIINYLFVPINKTWFCVGFLVIQLVITLLVIFDHIFIGVLQKDNDELVTGWSIYLHICRKSTWKLENISSHRLIFPGVTLLLGVVLAICWLVCRWNFSTYLLYLLVANVLWNVNYYVAMKVIHGEFTKTSWRFPAVYFGLAAVFGGFAMHFFADVAAQWEKSPAESKTFNQRCLNMFGLEAYPYDSHDAWHFLSATSLFFAFNGLLVLDEDLVSTQTTQISVF
ncbi:SID1 transmembrane family member 2, partial [Orchesella cincta]